VEGRPSRASATAALKAHVAVLKGKPLRAAIAEALAKGGNLGGKERHYVAFATRELSRHLRWLDLLARELGSPLSKLELPEDQATLRYAIWRRFKTQAASKRVFDEVKLPGPLRPRSMPDAMVSQLLERPPPKVVLPDDPLEAAAVEHSFPTWLAAAIEKAAPEGEAAKVLEALNREPPLVFRVRPPGTRAEVIEALRKRSIATVPLDESEDALEVTESRAIFDSGEMKNGRLQVMDLGSQLLAAQCRVQPGQTVIDYCAGAGGKTIFLADQAGPTGRVVAHDNSARRLNEARTRVKQARLKNVSFEPEPRLAEADVVLVDAPCSGTGTLSREPDAKWRLTAKKVTELAAIQSALLDEVAGPMKKGATLVYGTCSVLAEEDEEVTQAFLKRHPEFVLEGELRVWPHQGRGSGFYAARLTRRQ
jgi:16S rRNA (cytosine967-C5)-methyltransferase